MKLKSIQFIMPIKISTSSSSITHNTILTLIPSIIHNIIPNKIETVTVMHTIIPNKISNLVPKSTIFKVFYDIQIFKQLFMTMGNNYI